MSSLTEDIASLEAAINQVIKQARLVHNRTMREQEDIHPSSPLALMELSVRSLSQADDAARYARHALGGPLPGSKGYDAIAAAKRDMVAKVREMAAHYESQRDYKAQAGQSDVALLLGHSASTLYTIASELEKET